MWYIISTVETKRGRKMGMATNIFTSVVTGLTETRGFGGKLSRHKHPQARLGQNVQGHFMVRMGLSLVKALG